MKTLMLWLTLSVLAVSAVAQSTALSSKLSEVGAEWLIGSWTGTDPDGRSFTLTYGQEFDGQAGTIHFKSGATEMKGLIAVDPDTDEVRQFAVTSSGVLVTGTWNDDGSGLALEVVRKSPNGPREYRTYVHRRVDDGTMRITVYDGPRWGGDTTTYEILLKRAP